VIAGTELESTQLAPGRLIGSMSQLLVGERSVSTAKISGSFRAYGPLSLSSYTFGAIIDTKGASTQWDFDARSGDVALVPAGESHDAVYSEYTNWITIGLPVEQVIELAELYDLDPKHQFWQTPAMHRPSRGTAQLVSRLLARAVESIEQCAEIAATPLAVSGLLDDAVEALFLGYGEISGSPLETRGSLVRANKLLKLVENYLETNIRTPIRLPAMCKSLGVSERTLRRVFVDKYGIPPRRFLIYRRLCQARRLLARGHCSSVTEAAVKSGFWDLSRFSHYYGALFGETPSATLGTQPAS